MTRTLVYIGSASHLKPSALGDSDRATLGIALRSFDQVVHALCPSGDELALVYAKAAGATDAGWLKDVESPQSDVSLVGLGALERLGGRFAGELAEHNRATLVFDVLDVKRNGQQFIVTRDASPRVREELVIAGPVVLVVSPYANRPPYVSRYRLQMAASIVNAGWGARPAQQDESLPVSVTNSSDAQTRPLNGWEPVRPRVRQAVTPDAGQAPAHNRLDIAFGLSASGREPQAASNIIQADAATCARHLLRYLAHHGFLAASAGAVDKLSYSAPTAADPEADKSNRTPSAAMPLADSAGHLSDRMARGPRTADTLPQRIARRPRPFHRDTKEASLTPRLDRRPRLLNDTGERLRRWPRLVKE